VVFSNGNYYKKIKEHYLAPPTIKESVQDRHQTFHQRQHSQKLNKQSSEARIFLRIPIGKKFFFWGHRFHFSNLRLEQVEGASDWGYRPRKRVGTEISQ
jgi:hypothetical protein